MSSQSPRMPKFGDWDDSQPQFTVIFNNMRADKSMKKGNPNDPAFLAELLNSSSASQAVAHDVNSPPQPPLQRGSPPKPSCTNHKSQSPHVPKFGEWDVDGENGVQQPFTVIFDQMHVDKNKKGFNPNDRAFLAGFANASNQPSAHESSKPPVKPKTRSSTNYKNTSPQVPKFGEWNGDGEIGEQQQFTVIFDNMHAVKNKKGFNPNDPESLTDLANSSSSSSSPTHEAVNIMNQPPPSPFRHGRSQAASKPTSKSHMNLKNPSPHVPKFGEWNGDGEIGEQQQQFTLIFDNMHAVKNKKGFNPNDPESLTDFVNSSSSSSSPTHAAVNTMNQPPPLPFQHGRSQAASKPSQAASKPTSKSHINQKQVVAPKFGDWDVNHPQEFTAIFDDMKHERWHGYVPASERPKRSTSPTTPLPKHKPFLVSLRLCFRSGHAVRD